MLCVGAKKEKLTFELVQKKKRSKRPKSTAHGEERGGRDTVAKFNRPSRSKLL